MDKDKIQRKFSQLSSEDRDLTMFTVTNLTMNKKEISNMVYMALKLKRKIATELLTTYLPTILLLLITFTTIFFDKDLFGDVIAVNLTIMLVKMVVITSMMVRLTAKASPKSSLSKRMLVKVMSSRRMVGRKVVSISVVIFLFNTIFIKIRFLSSDKTKFSIVKTVRSLSSTSRELKFFRSPSFPSMITWRGKA